MRSHGKHVRQDQRRRVTRFVSALGLIAGSVGIAALLPGVNAQADSTLGGFTVTTTSAAARITYEQPNLPLPATPSVEVSEGYSQATDNFGPTGIALASVLWPGQVIANAGPELGAFLPGLPLPPAPVYPVSAQSSFPSTPNTASSDQPGLTMETTSTADGNVATAAFGNANPTTPGTGGSTTPGLPPTPNFPGLGGLLGLTPPTSSTPSASDPLASLSGIIDIQGLSSSSSSKAIGGTAVATGTAVDSGISLLGGLIYIGSVTSSATATSDGTTGSVGGSTSVANASIDGDPIDITTSGITVGGANETAGFSLASVLAGLTSAGITISVTTPVDAIKGSSASRELDGVEIQINLTALDKMAPTLTNLIPPSVLSELPVPVPNEQILTIYFATVQVASDASPAYVYDAGSSGNAGSGSSGGGLSASSVGGGSSSSNFGGGSSGLGTTGTTGTSGTSPSGGGSGTTVGTQIASASGPFKGVGAGVILLGVLAALALMLGAMRATTVAEAMAGAGGALGDPGGFEGDDELDGGGL